MAGIQFIEHRGKRILLLDFSGVDIFYGAMRDRHERGEGPPPRKTLQEKVDRKELGRKTGKGFYSYEK